MENTNCARKIDSIGRLTIPSKLREKLHLEEGKPYTFFTHEEDGKMYLCIECFEKPNEIQQALETLAKNGYFPDRFAN